MMKMNHALKSRLPSSWFTYFFICIFGIGSWIAVNGIWAEISILVNSTPECVKLPAILVVIIQLANFGPLLYGCIKYLFHCCKLQAYKIHLESGAIVVLIIIGITACVLLSFLWNRTSMVYNGEHSIALFILTFFLSLVDCTSSVLFVPFMKHFSEQYMSALYIGEGLSGLLPSLFALSQGSVNSNISCNGNYTGHEDLGIRFSPSVYFVFLSGMLFLCGCSFVIIVTLPAIRKHMVYNNKKISINFKKNPSNCTHFPNCIQKIKNNCRTSSDCANLSRNQKLFEDESLPEDNDEDNNFSEFKKSQFSFATMYRIIKSNFVIYICLLALNFLANGALSAVTSFAFLPYGNNVYHIAINVALLVNPVMSLIFLMLPSKSALVTAINTAIASVLGVYIIVMAQSPFPAFQAHFIAKFLVVS